jgi:hypothetical protein
MNVITMSGVMVTLLRHSGDPGLRRRFDLVCCQAAALPLHVRLV